MQRTKGIVIFVLILICIYSLFSQFYLQKFGNYYTYIINPIFFIILALILKMILAKLYINNSIKKKVMIYAGITAFIYVLFYLLSGLFVTFGKNPYNTSIQGLLLNLYSIGIVILAKEYIRFKLINSVQREDKKLIFILIVIVFSISEMTLNLMIDNLNIYYFFKTFFVSIIPVIVKNCLFTYISKYTNYIPSVLYEMIIYLFLWISPILPKVPWIYTAIMDLVFPVVLLYYLNFEISKKDRRHVYKRDKTVNPKGLIPFVVGVVLIAFFSLGIFPIKPVGIASGSMFPSYSVGDLALVRKCSANEINVDDVIEYQRKDFSVIHRVVDKYVKDDKTYFITKGDNNNVEDADPVKEDQIVGVVFFKIPYLAYPTIWMNMNNNSNVDVELGK